MHSAFIPLKPHTRLALSNQHHRLFWLYHEGAAVLIIRRVNPGEMKGHLHRPKAPAHSRRSSCTSWIIIWTAQHKCMRRTVQERKRCDWWTPGDPLNGWVKKCCFSFPLSLFFLISFSSLTLPNDIYQSTHRLNLTSPRSRLKRLKISLTLISQVVEKSWSS